MSIEAARAFAALAVVLMHAANPMRVEHFSGHVGMGWVFDFGYIGIEKFVCASSRLTLRTLTARAQRARPPSFRSWQHP